MLTGVMLTIFVRVMLNAMIWLPGMYWRSQEDTPEA